MKVGLNHRALFALQLLVIAVVQFGLLVYTHFPLPLAIIDATVSYVIMVNLGFVVAMIQRNFHAPNPINITNLSIAAGFTVFYQLLTNSAFIFLIGYEDWNIYIHPHLPIRGVLAFFMLILVSFYWWIIRNEQENKQIQQQLIEKERALTKAGLDNIHQQLQPHFLFNSLNSINALTMVNPAEAGRMIQLLSEFLRGTLKKDVQQLVPLNDELRQIQLYLEIEQVRFGHRLKVEFPENPECENLLIPTLILQPLIENAIKYGLYGSLSEVTISIHVRCSENQLFIEIQNPFDADAGALKGSGFGLSSIRSRLQLTYRQSDLLKTSTTGNIFTAIIQIPQYDKGNDH